MTCSEKKEPKGSASSSTERKACAHGVHPWAPFQGYKDEPGKPHCLTCGHAERECDGHQECQHPNKHATGARYSAADGEIFYSCPEPPMTPEEEEQAPEDEALPCTCSSRMENEDGEVLHDEDCDANLTPYRGEHGYPPQPDRRPPLLVAYSVAGHLYEVALPGDATVRAVDGALVITHHLGPVAGIVQVLPVISEESA